MTKKKPRQKIRNRMNHGLAVFNLHVNNAGRRADEEFIAQFGEKRYRRHILPLHRAGIMTIFNKKPNQWQLVWVALVTAFVNEDRREVYGSSLDTSCALAHAKEEL